MKVNALLYYLHFLTVFLWPGSWSRCIWDWNSFGYMLCSTCPWCCVQIGRNKQSASHKTFWRCFEGLIILHDITSQFYCGHALCSGFRSLYLAKKEVTDYMGRKATLLWTLWLGKMNRLLRYSLICLQLNSWHNLCIVSLPFFSAISIQTIEFFRNCN